MGIYLNPSNDNFKLTLSSGMYVDKTMMLGELNRFIDTGNQYVCISRPRRFGKTIAANMLTAYYSKGCDSSEIFGGLKIDDVDGYEDKLNKYNVIKIDLNSEYQSIGKDKGLLIDRLTNRLKSEMAEEFPGVAFRDDDSMAESILRIYMATHERFVVLIDEYDVLVREEAGSELFDRYLSFLSSMFKSDTVRPAIALAYLTGILPIVKDRIQSKLNSFNLYTIMDADTLAPYVGFTDEEVRLLCEDNDIDYEECRSWYNGYVVDDIRIYNPESVIKSVTRRRFADYWSRTSTYSAITDRIQMNFDGIREDVIRMIAGEEVDVNVTSFMNTMDSFHSKNDVFTYLIHIGYLAYNWDKKTCRIPNREISTEWINAVEIDDNYRITNEIISASKQLLQYTIDGNCDEVSKALDISHIHVTSNRSYNNEDALQSAIYLAYIYALNDYICVREMTAGKGFADLVYIPLHPDDNKRPAMIIELKRNDSAASGLTQIKDKRYYECLSNYTGTILLISINYDETDKTHSSIIESVVK